MLGQQQVEAHPFLKRAAQFKKIKAAFKCKYLAWQSIKNKSELLLLACAARLLWKEAIYIHIGKNGFLLWSIRNKYF